MTNPARFAAFITGGAPAAAFTELHRRIWRRTVSERLMRWLNLIERFPPLVPAKAAVSEIASGFPLARE
jgi:hypothetical protein